MSGEQRPAPFPWREAMAFGLGRLGLSGEAFWRMTPRELAAAIEGYFGRAGAPIGRAAFEQLAERYPDKP
jgi:uncharacterized phage protein (TIGR02216 family)